MSDEKKHICIELKLTWHQVPQLMNTIKELKEHWTSVADIF